MIGTLGKGWPRWLAERGPLTQPIRPCRRHPSSAIRRGIVENVFLMGYSNGAVGVTRAAIREPELFQGLIYLSPITEEEFSAGQLEMAIRHCRFLFLHGGLDRRIPRSFVEGTVASLERFECDVRLKIYDDEDHYLLFSQQEAVLREISEFMMD